MYTYDIDFHRVVRDDRVVGNIPGEMNTAIGWVVGTLLIQVTRAAGAVVATDNHPTSIECADLFGHGVTNSGHFKATASLAGAGGVDYLLHCCRTLSLPGCHITTSLVDGASSEAGEVTELRLFDASGEPITVANGLETIRKRLIADQIPRPVSIGYRGQIVDRTDLVSDYVREGEQ